MAHPAQKHHDMDRKIGAEVRSLRKQLGLTQQDLAEALGVSFQQIQKYEKGSNRIAVSTLIAISRFFEVSPSAIVDHVAGEQPTMADELRNRTAKFETLEKRTLAIRGILDGSISIDHLDLPKPGGPRASAAHLASMVQ